MSVKNSRRGSATRRVFGLASRSAVVLAMATGAVGVASTQFAVAQSYSFSGVSVQGTQRMQPATVLNYAGLSNGPVSAGELNDAYQRVLASGLFETVEFIPNGNTLVIKVTEFPTINKIAIEGNKRLKDDRLSAVLQSQSRRVYNPAVAIEDAARIAAAYQDASRISATVTPQIIRRSDNRVDLVFEITEGNVVEVERLSFVGNQSFSEYRLRRVLGTKQAGFLRAIVQRDTFSADRVEFDKRVLSDFYKSRGYIDFQILDVRAEVARERDGYFLTYNIREGQRYAFAQTTTVSDLPEVDIAEFERLNTIRAGQIYSPVAVDDVIERMERHASKLGLNFIRVEPRITRNAATQQLDVTFALVRGERIFVERIDIEGNATTLDRVVRNQFRIVEGDPFNPREVREAAERIRALRFFGTADVDARQGSAPDQMIVGVKLSEEPTGSFTFGANFGVSSGLNFIANYNERNFLGRGQSLNFDVQIGKQNSFLTLNFYEPALMGRNVGLGFDLFYNQTSYSYATYTTSHLGFSPSLTFPLGERTKLKLDYRFASEQMEDVTSNSPLLIADEALGRQTTSSVGYTWSFDNRRSGYNTNAGVVLRFGQEFAGAGGDTKYIKTKALIAGETKVMNEQLTLRATLEGGALTSLGGDARAIDRFNVGPAIMRGFEPGGFGPRDDGDMLGGNYFGVLRLESEFPLGLPEEYGISGGLFADVGSVWGLDNTTGFAGAIDDSMKLRAVVGASLFWETGIGPLRFNFTKALMKEAEDKEQTFDLTISTKF